MTDTHWLCMYFILLYYLSIKLSISYLSIYLKSFAKAMYVDLNYSIS